MATIKDIAKRAGVSTATISNVLNNNKSKVGEKTRKRVLEIIEEMDYKPNSVASSLRTNRTRTIGVVIEDIGGFASGIIKGINEYAAGIDFHLILEALRLEGDVGDHPNIIFQYKEEINESIKILLNKQVEGLIYIGCHVRDITDFIEKLPVPIVYTYCYTTDELSYSVNYNDELAAYEATEYLIKAGHQKIGIISAPIDSIHSHKRFLGYQKAIIDNNLVFNPAYIKTGDWLYETGYKYGKELVEQSDRPTAIMAMNDVLAAAALDAAKDCGLRVPEELSVIGFDNRELSYYHDPRITTIKLPLHKMGLTSMKMLYEVINNQLKEGKSENLRCELIERDSVSNI